MQANSIYDNSIQDNCIYDNYIQDISRRENSRENSSRHFTEFKKMYVRLFIMFHILSRLLQSFNDFLIIFEISRSYAQILCLFKNKKMCWELRTWDSEPHPLIPSSNIPSEITL